MSSVLVFYLLGVVVVTVMVSKDVATAQASDWKLKGILRTLMWMSLSWITVSYVAIKACWN